LMESLFPSSVYSVMRISWKKVRQQRSKQKNILTPFLVFVRSNTLCLNKVSTKDGCNFVPQLYGFFVDLGVRLALVLKSIRAHLLAKRW